MNVPLNVPSHVVQELAIEHGATRPSFTAASMAHRSPSAVPAMEIDEMISKEEQTTSERYRSLLPSIEEQMNHQPHISSQQRTSPSTSTANFVVAIPLFGHQRDQYQSTANESIDNSSRHLLLDRLRDILIHPDLDNPEALAEADVDPAQQLEWDIQSSAKFQWMREFFEHVQLGLQEQQRSHVAILVRSDSRVNLLRRFFKAFDGPSEHAEDSEPVELPGVRFSIITQPAQLLTLPPVSFLISLDGGLGHIDSLALPPHAQLVVPFSIEHIDLSTTAHEPVDDTFLHQTVRVLCHQAGRLDELPEIADTAQAVAEALTGNGDVQTQEHLEVVELDQSDEQRLHSWLHLPPLDLDSLPITNGTHIGNKRSLEDLHDNSPAKRFRSTDVDSSADADLDDVPLIDSTLQHHYETALTNEHARRAELETNLADLQYRFEAVYTQLGEVTKERDAAIETAQKAVTRMNEQTDNLRNLKASMIQLRDKLTECEANLASHSIPERAELEAFRQAAAKATENEEKATAKLDNIKKDLTYAQTLYQDASTKAQGFAGENEVLTRQLAIAEDAASTQRANLRQMSFDNVTKNLSRDNKQLRTMLELRDIALAARDEEIVRLKETNRGRMGTRGTSVPRSPRMSSPAKLGHSRHGSPHPLRNG